MGTFTPQWVTVGGERVENIFHNSRLLYINEVLKCQLTGGEVFDLHDKSSEIFQHVICGVLSTPVSINYRPSGGVVVTLTPSSFTPQPIGGIGDVYWINGETYIDMGVMPGRNILTGEVVEKHVIARYGTGSDAVEGSPMEILHPDTALGNISSLPQWVIDDFTIYHRGEWSILDVKTIHYRSVPSVMVAPYLYYNNDAQMWLISGQHYRWDGSFRREEKDIDDSTLTGMLLYLSTPDGICEVGLT